MSIEDKCRALLGEDKFQECRILIENELASMPDSPVPQNLLGILEEKRFEKDKNRF